MKQRLLTASLLVALAGVTSALASGLGTATVYLQDTNTTADGGESVLVALTDASGSPMTLNHALPAGAKITGFQTSPDGRYVVYTATNGPSMSIDVYSVPIDQSASPVKLSVTPAHVMDASKFKISPDGKTVIYRADQDTDNKFELYSAPIDGQAAAVKISGTITNVNGDVSTTNFQISPDSTRVVFTADADVDTVDEMFSVPIGGGTRIKLHANLSAGDDTFNPLISPNSARVVYVAKKGGDFAQYSAAINATGDVKLNDAASTPLLSGDSTRVIYVDDQLVGGVFEVFSVLITGGGALRISGPKPPGASTFPTPRLAPDGTTVVYTTDEDTAGQNELYAAGYTTVGSPVKLSGTAQGVTSDVFAFQFSDDGSTVIYSGDQDTNGMTEVYVAAITGGSPTKVNDMFQPSGDAVFTAVTRSISANGLTQVYLADQVTNNLNEVFVQMGSGAVKAHGPIVAGDTLDKVQLSVDDQHVIFRKFDSVNSKLGLFATPVGTSNEMLLSAELTLPGGILSYVNLPLNDNDGDLDPDLSDPDDDNDGLTDTSERSSMLDPFSGDTDGDSLGDSIDLDPATSSNLCTGTNAVLMAAVIPGGTTGQCAADSSATLKSAGVIIKNGATLEVYSPTVIFDDDFAVYTGATLIVFSQDPTPGV